MSVRTGPVSNVKIRGQQKRRIAERLIAWHRICIQPASQEPRYPIKVVCVADTHNKQPDLPNGDILIHAGDLTENGSFDEVQAGLRWLSSQPHRYKILVAGNHDVLLDEDFLSKYPERRYGQQETKEDLDWGNVIHLQDASIRLNFGNQESKDELMSRTVSIYGSPLSPQYGISAFQYHPNSPDIWEDKLGSMEFVDILITHGPPKLHLDSRDFYRAGCPYLSAEVARLRPRFHVFGHIHAAHGREDIVIDSTQRAYEDVIVGWGGWGTVAWMVALVIWSRLRWVFRGLRPVRGRPTTFLNAAVVGGPKNDLVHAPLVLEL